MKSTYLRLTRVPQSRMTSHRGQRLVDAGSGAHLKRNGRAIGHPVDAHPDHLGGNAAVAGNTSALMQSVASASLG